MKHTIKKIAPFFLLFFVGCQSDEVRLLPDKNNSYDIDQEKEKNIPPVVQRSEESFLNALGVSYKDDKIIIDLNKTDQFFVVMEKRADEKAKALEKKLNEINISKEAGILVDQTHLSIDLNKTQTLLKNISNLFENILLESNATNY